jgi:trimethylamine--corrinoid protein Co-methyltransferase
MLGQVLRCVRGIEVTEDAVSMEVIRQTCLGGPGHYLGSAQTLQLMQTDYVYPVVADRMSPKEWNEVGRPDLLDRAMKRKARLLEEWQPVIDPATDRAIRERFRIHF